jgi:copper(I)-binding protein
MARFRLTAFAAFIALSTPAFAHEGILHDGCPTGQSFAAGGITVTGAYARATPKGAQSAGGYLTIANTGPVADTLLSVSSAAASDVGLHQMKMNGNVMEMAPLEGGLVIPPGGSVSLDPMGDHLMFTGMGQPFVEGQCVEITLHFADAGDLPVALNIGGFGQKEPPAASNNVPDNSSGDMDMSSMSMPM